jgi:leucyl/phenylalanyl-tRNA--protein transferase
LIRPDNVIHITILAVARWPGHGHCIQQLQSRDESDGFALHCRMLRISFLDPDLPDAFPPVSHALAHPDGLLAAGGDLSPERLLAAYRRGIFPWYSDDQPILWWSPAMRTVFDTGNLHVPRRLSRWLRGCDWQLRADSAFADVMQACAEPRRHQSGTWITDDMLAAYRELHALGHAHSVEAWDGDRLVGGIYGVALGRMFYGESMFSIATNGSKVALLGLCRAMREWGWPLLDAQVASEHLFTLGAREMPRTAFCARIGELTRLAERAGSWRASFPSLEPPDLAS